MIYVGIDVAKTTHYAAAADSDGVVLCEVHFKNRFFSERAIDHRS